LVCNFNSRTNNFRDYQYVVYIELQTNNGFIRSISNNGYFWICFSIPTYIIYYLVYYTLGSKNTNTKLINLILITLAVIGITISFSITFNNREPEITIAYILTSIISGIIFKLDFKNDYH